MMKQTVVSPARLATHAALIGAALLMTGCSIWNPFAKPPANAPLALQDIKPTMQPRVLWTQSIGKAGISIFSPAFAASSVFVAGSDGSIARLDAATGRPQWRINAGSNLTAGVGSDGESVAVVGAKGMLMVFDGEGKLRWKEQLSSGAMSAPAVGSGLVVVRSGDNRITAFDAQSGAKRWTVLRTTPPLILQGAPGVVIDSGTVYVAQPGGKLGAFNSLNGGVRWESVVADPKGATELERVVDVVGQPIVAEHEVCATSYQGRLACFDISAGVVRWSKEFPSQVGPAVDTRFIFAVDTKSVVSAFAREAGANVWRNEKLMFRGVSAPVSIGRAVAVGDYKGVIHFLSREDGAFMARLNTDGSPIQGTPLIAGAQAIFQTQSGSVVAVATE